MKFPLKGASQKRRQVKRKFSMVKIGRFCRFQRVLKICGISRVMIKNLQNENSASGLTPNSNFIILVGLFFQ